MPDKWDILGIAGYLCIASGVSWIYAPAGLIVLGVGLFATYVLREMSNVPVPRDESHSDDDTAGGVE